MQATYSEKKPLVCVDRPVEGLAPQGKFNGQTVFKDDLETYKALHCLRIKDATSPIHRRYKWAGPYTPMKHQRVTAAFLTLHKRAYVLNGIGTGKTNACGWAADFLMQEKEIHRVLVLTPLSTMMPVWGDMFFRHFPHLGHIIMHGLLRKKIFSDPDGFSRERVFIANHEVVRAAGFVKCIRQLKFDLVIVDEGSMFCSYDTDKFKGMKALLSHIPRCWWLTATPTPNAPTNAWGQAALMGTSQGIRFAEFRDLTMRPAGPYQWKARDDAEKWVKKILSPAIRYRPEDCIDLPSLTYQTRQAVMTNKQMAAYKTLKKEAVLMTEAGPVTAINAAVEMTKLLQIVSGVVYAGERGTESQAEWEIEPTGKLEEVKRVIEDSEGHPVILFAPFKSVLKYLAAKLKEHSPEIMDGDVSAERRTDIFRRFQDGKIPLLLAHPRTMSHGVTLTRSSTIIWYTPVFSNDTYTQANGRIYRQGQERHCTVVHLSSSDIETEIYRRLKERQDVQERVLELFERV
jgi:SNF2 family DNA or RNA helicase